MTERQRLFSTQDEVFYVASNGVVKAVEILDEAEEFSSVVDEVETEVAR